MISPTEACAGPAVPRPCARATAARMRPMIVWRPYALVCEHILNWQLELHLHLYLLNPPCIDLVVLRERMAALGAFVEHRLALIRGA